MLQVIHATCATLLHNLVEVFSGLLVRCSDMVDTRKQVSRGQVSVPLFKSVCAHANDAHTQDWQGGCGLLLQGVTL